MADETFNGYVNRETWAAHLHLSNDPDLYDMARDHVADAIANDMHPDLVLKEKVANLIEMNRDAQDNDGDFGSDALTMMDREVGSWWRVDWKSVAEGFMPDVD